MPLFSSSFKVGPDAPSTPSSANAKASRQLEFDYTVPPDQYQGQAAVAGTALPGTDHQKQGDTQTSPLFRPTPSKDSHTNALGIEGSPSSSQGQGQTPSQPPPGRLQELGLQHRPSNASDHPFDDDTEDEDLGAGVRLGQARRKGSSVSLATLDLATVQEQEEDEVCDRSLLCGVVVAVTVRAVGWFGGMRNETRGMRVSSSRSGHLGRSIRISGH